MELQNLVKVKVRTLDPDAEPVEVTVAASEGQVSARQVFSKVCDCLGLKASSYACFSLFEGGERPVRRYRLTDDIEVNSSDLYLSKWCFISGQEKDVLHQDPAATHLVFLQARQDVHTGKFDLSTEDKQKLDECLEPGFMAKDQYVLLCQKQPSYYSLFLPQCTLLSSVVAPSGSFDAGSDVKVTVSKFGLKLTAGHQTVSFIWFEVSGWTLHKEKGTLTLVWRPDKDTEGSDVPLATPQAELMLSAVLEMITMLQRDDKTGACFHTDMISLKDDGRLEFENSVYNPSKAKGIQYSV